MNSTRPRKLKDALDELVRSSISDVLQLESQEADPYLSQAKNPKFGDYQSNAMMALAKRFQKNPRELGEKVRQKILAHPDYSRLLDKCELAGPGFLNLHLSGGALQERLTPEHLVQPRELQGAERQTVVVDYSSPNIAKEMHVGHIRSTILGDAIARVLEHLGHQVVRQNHLGDWGTQFGMLIAFFRRHPERLATADLSSIESNYREANELFNEDKAFETQAREAVVQLHEKEPSTVKLWEKVVSLSMAHLQSNYDRLRISLKPEDARGESFYNPALSKIVERLKGDFVDPEGRAVVAVNDGAVCVFLQDEKGESLFHNSENEPLPFLIQKSDGAFLYATTDLAALDYRVRELRADWLIYVTDNRQSLHFDMLFGTAKATGLDQKPEDSGKARLQHITFGTILGSDRRPLKTRDGGTVKLSSLLEEAVERALERVPEGLESRGEVAERVGIGAIKYADLSQNRQTDYTFTWDKLLALEGNTAAYLLYAYARLSKMLREATDSYEDAQIFLSRSTERQLALELCRFPETLDSLPAEWRMNGLTDQLYKCAGALMKFYDECPVLKENDESTRRSRLKLCQLTAQVLKTGLGLLGIDTVERM